MTRLFSPLLIALVAMPGYGMLEPANAQSENQLGFGDLNCIDFVPIADGGLDHAQAVLDATEAINGADLYDLDGDGDDANGLACDGQGTDIGDGTADCGSFVSAADGGQEHAQALYDAAGPNIYDLDVVNGIACPQSAPDEPSDPAPSRPSTAGCAIVAEVAHASACAGGQARVGLDAEEDTVPTAASGSVSTGAMFSLTQRTAEQGVRSVESEQQAKRSKAKKRKLAKKRQRIKERKAKRKAARQRLRQQQEAR